MVNAVHIG